MPNVPNVFKSIKACIYAIHIHHCMHCAGYEVLFEEYEILFESCVLVIKVSKHDMEVFRNAYTCGAVYVCLS